VDSAKKKKTAKKRHARELMRENSTDAERSGMSSSVDNQDQKKEKCKKGEKKGRFRHRGGCAVSWRWVRRWRVLEGVAGQRQIGLKRSGGASTSYKVRGGGGDRRLPPHPCR